MIKQLTNVGQINKQVLLPWALSFGQLRPLDCRTKSLFRLQGRYLLLMSGNPNSYAFRFWLMQITICVCMHNSVILQKGWLLLVILLVFVKRIEQVCWILIVMFEWIWRCFPLLVILEWFPFDFCFMFGDCNFWNCKLWFRLQRMKDMISCHPCWVYLLNMAFGLVLLTPQLFPIM